MFVEAVKGVSPAPDWRETVALMPVIFPHELPRLARLTDLGDIAVEDLYTAGKVWIDSMLKQSMRIAAVQIMMARVKSDQLGLCENKKSSRPLIQITLRYALPIM